MGYAPNSPYVMEWRNYKMTLQPIEEKKDVGLYYGITISGGKGLTAKYALPDFCNEKISISLPSTEIAYYPQMYRIVRHVAYTNGITRRIENLLQRFQREYKEKSRRLEEKEEHLREVAKRQREEFAKLKKLGHNWPADIESQSARFREIFGDSSPICRIHENLLELEKDVDFLRASKKEALDAWTAAIALRDTLKKHVYDENHILYDPDFDPDKAEDNPLSEAEIENLENRISSHVYDDY